MKIFTDYKMIQMIKNYSSEENFPQVEVNYYETGGIKDIYIWHVENCSYKVLESEKRPSYFGFYREPKNGLRQILWYWDNEIHRDKGPAAINKDSQKTKYFYYDTGLMYKEEWYNKKHELIYVDEM